MTDSFQWDLLFENRGQRVYQQLLQRGFTLAIKEEKELSFSRGDILISLVIDLYAHEIEAYLQDLSYDITIRLHDALLSCPASSAVGVYQFSSPAQVPNGIVRILESVLYVIDSQADLESFVCEANRRVQTRKKTQAKKSEVKVILEQGDIMWQRGEMQSAAQVYKRYPGCLSEIQAKRLSYAEAQNRQRAHRERGNGNAAK